jgi:hypothetical protein
MFEFYRMKVAFLRGEYVVSEIQGQMMTRGKSIPYSPSSFAMRYSKRKKDTTYYYFSSFERGSFLLNDGFFLLNFERKLEWIDEKGSLIS